MTVELQVRLKSMKEILNRSHKIRSMMKADDIKTAKGKAALLDARDQIANELDDVWFRALGKQSLASEELIDQPIHVGTKEIDGEIVDIYKPTREFVEEDIKAAQALERLKDCT